MPEETDVDLAAIWDEHRAGTFDRLTVLEQAAIAVLEGTLDPELCAAARREAHTLAGSVSFFGFTEGTALARDLEKRFDGVPDQSEAPALAELVEALRRSIEGPVGRLPTIARRLLVVDHALGAAVRLGGAAVAAGVAIVPAVDQASALVALQTDPVDAAVVAASLPGAIELIELLVAAGTPVIGTGDGSDAALRVAVGRAGAVSFADMTTQPEDIVADAVRAAGAPELLIGARIVVVDDDPTVVATVQGLLRGCGAEGFPADPDRLWDALAAHDPHLLLLDVELPGLSGIDLCRAVRADPTWRQLPVVFLTAARDPETLSGLLSAGADDRITKPLVESSFGRRLARTLQARDRARPAALSTEATEVLVVDDDPIIADILLRALAARGHRARWIEDGAVAAEVLASTTGTPPKVVLLDIDLPGLDGYGVLQRAAAAGTLAHSRFIVLTGRSSESETVRALELGAFDHMAKPFSIPVLMQRVRRALEG